MNRTGDMVLSIGFFALFGLFGTLNYETIFSLAPHTNDLAITIVSLLLVGGSLAKSAQIPLHSWLPGSMEAPTPVSALLHAATLVTAGIYLLLRSSPILEYSPTALLILTFIGSTTAFVAATSGLVQNDLKRIVAFSTISQLGYMMMAVGLSQYNVALFHVINHSFFKALLFLASGSIIHSAADQQDVRKLGGLIKFLPVTYSLMMVGTLSLMALPFVSGFYSKDLILELAYGQYSFSGTYAFIFGSLTAFLTAFYSFRLLSLVFLTKPNGPKESYINSHESSIIIIIPMFILGLLSIFFGYLFSDLFVGMGSDFSSSVAAPTSHYIYSYPSVPAAQPALHMHGAGEAVLNQIKEESLYYINTAGIFSETINEYLPQRGTGTVALFIHPDNISIVEAEFSLPVLIKLLPTILSITGAILAIFLYNKNINFVVKLTEIPFFSKLYTFLNSKYYFDVIYNNYVIKNGYLLGYTVSEDLDKGVIELVGPYGLSSVLTETAKNIAKLDTGLIPSYIIYIISGFMFLILFTFSPLVLGVNFTGSIRLLILYLPTLYFLLNFLNLVEYTAGRAQK
jgi:NADH-ubiquinone oxidoreductase chain 5